MILFAIQNVLAVLHFQFVWVGMMADRGNLYKDIGAPQWIIDWNQAIIDTYYNK
jgi:hypothetical protein